MDKRAALLIAILLSILHAVLAITATLHKSPTFDEPVHITAGYSYWLTNDFRLDPENGSLSSRWAALPLLAMGPVFPLESSDWKYSNASAVSQQFFYRGGNDADTLLVCARAMNVLSYSSYAGGWGITYWAVHFLDAMNFDVTPQGLNVLLPLLLILKSSVVVSVLALAWFRRAKSGTEFLTTIALAWTCFAIFAPGFIPYYLVWPAPFILVYSTRWYVLLTAASSIYLFAYYNMMSHGMPWNVADPTVPPAWNDWGILPWFVLVGIGITTASRRLFSRAPLSPLATATS